MSVAKLMCGKKPPSNLKEFTKFYKVCNEYAKCDHKKCNDAELKLSSEVMKLPIDKTFKIMEKCMKVKGDKRQCTLNEQKNLSPKIKKLAEEVESCRNEKCKKESDEMVNAANSLLNSQKMKKPIKDIMKGIKMIRKSKTLKKIVQKDLKHKIKSMMSKQKKRTQRK